MGRIEGSLFHLRKVILGIAIQYEPADGHRGIVSVRPHLGQIERVKALMCRLGYRHDLHL
jgi:hypothetical protein